MKFANHAQAVAFYRAYGMDQEEAVCAADVIMAEQAGDVDVTAADLNPSGVTAQPKIGVVPPWRLGDVVDFG